MYIFYVFQFEQFWLYLWTTRPNMKRIHAIRLAFLANLLCYKFSKTCNSLSLDYIYRKGNTISLKGLQKLMEKYTQYLYNIKNNIWSIINKAKLADIRRYLNDIKNILT